MNVRLTLRLGVLLVGVALVVLARSTAADAQFLDEDVVGYPIRIVRVDLVPGTRYRIRTTDLVAAPGLLDADTVMSVRTTDGAGSTTIAGADGCVDFERPGVPIVDWASSCFEFRARTSASRPTARTVPHYLFIRARQQLNSGTCHLELQQYAAATRSWGGWRRFTDAPVAFGGQTVRVNIPRGTRRFRIETALAPGTSIFHGIWLAPYLTNDLKEDLGWVYRHISIANSTRIPGSAELDLDATASRITGEWVAVFGSILATQAGNVRLLRNDWFEPGADYDGDGLGLALEDDLSTCDRPAQFAGIIERWECADIGVRGRRPCRDAPASEECLDALRDSDHDGVRDDVETYGMRHALLRFPMYGADPAHMDFFVDVDTFDRRPVSPGCEGFTAPGSEAGLAAPWSADSRADLPGIDYLGYPRDVLRAGWPQALLPGFTTAPPTPDAVAAIWAGGTTEINPDRRAGVALHFDVGFTDPRGLRFTTYGAWGGGNGCARDVYASGSSGDPRNASGSPGCANYEAIGNHDASSATGCPSLAGGAPLFAEVRRFAFGWAIDQLGDEGGLPGQGGGSMLRSWTALASRTSSGTRRRSSTTRRMVVPPTGSRTIRASG